MPLASSVAAVVEHHFSLYSKYLEHHVKNAVDELLDNSKYFEQYSHPPPPLDRLQPLPQDFEVFPHLPRDPSTAKVRAHRGHDAACHEEGPLHYVGQYFGRACILTHRRIGA